MSELTKLNEAYFIILQPKLAELDFAGLDIAGLVCLIWVCFDLNLCFSIPDDTIFHTS